MLSSVHWPIRELQKGEDGPDYYASALLKRDSAYNLTGDKGLLAVSGRFDLV